VVDEEDAGLDIHRDVLRLNVVSGKGTVQEDSNSYFERATQMLSTFHGKLVDDITKSDCKCCIQGFPQLYTKKVSELPLAREGKLADLQDGPKNYPIFQRMTEG
jgi:hypothetical protein